MTEVELKNQIRDLLTKTTEALFMMPSLPLEPSVQSKIETALLDLFDTLTVTDRPRIKVAFDGNKLMIMPYNEAAIQLMFGHDEKTVEFMRKQLELNEDFIRRNEEFLNRI